MSQNPGVLALHFLVEVAALAGLGYWAWTQHHGAARWGWLALPLVAAAAWAVFRAAEDGPEPMVTVPGIVRLVLEVAVLGGATVLLWRAAQPMAALVLGGVIILDYALSYDRVWRLLGLS